MIQRYKHLNKACLFKICQNLSCLIIGQFKLLYSTNNYQSLTQQEKGSKVEIK